ncbi:MAG TPA: zinc ribbon domain-containing protein [Terriglobales bacterium]|jgi:putative FmdB family regulatory protein
MPQYEFFCHACNRPFSKTLTPTEGKEGYVVCPHCGSDEGEQRWIFIITATRNAGAEAGPMGLLPSKGVGRDRRGSRPGISCHRVAREPGAAPPKGSQHGGRYANKEAKRVSRWSGH